MRDLQAHTAILHDFQHFVYRFQQPVVFVAHVHHDDTIVARHHLGHGGEFIGVAITAGWID